MNNKWGVWRAVALCVCALAVPMACQGADGFSLRHNMAGGLGSELFQTGHAVGWRGGLALGYTSIDRVTGADGDMLRTTVPAGVAPVPSLPSSQYPAYAAQSVGVASQGSQRAYSLSLTHSVPANDSGFKREWSIIVPYGSKSQKVTPVNAIPALAWPTPSVLSPAQQAGFATVGFAPAYQAALDQQAAAETGDTTGLGDIELVLQWVKDTPDSRLIVGAGLITPTGRYDLQATSNMSSGRFYTLKPSVIYVRRWAGGWSTGVRAALGLNTTNHQNQVRSGNFAGMELALGKLTAVGSLGLHVMQAQQIQNDAGGSWGSNRYASTNWGWSFATKLPVVNLGMSLQHGRTLRSRNAQEGAFTQLRFSKSF